MAKAWGKMALPVAGMDPVNDAAVSPGSLPASGPL